MTVLRIDHNPVLGSAWMALDGEPLLDGHAAVWRGLRPGPLISRAVAAVQGRGGSGLEIHYHGPLSFLPLAKLANHSGHLLRCFAANYPWPQIFEATLDGVRRGGLSGESLSRTVQGLDTPRWNVAFVAQFSVGKSTLINAFLGTDLLPASNRPTTSCPTTIKPVRLQEGARIRIQRSERWSSENAVEPIVMKRLNGDPEVTRLLVDHPLFKPDLGHGYELRLTDLPGPDHASSREHRNKFVDYLNNSRVDQVLFVSVPTKLQDQGELDLLERLHSRASKMGIAPHDWVDVVVNKVDVLAQDEDEDAHLPQLLRQHRGYLERQLSMFVDFPVAVSGGYALLARKVLWGRSLSEQQKVLYGSHGRVLGADLSQLGMEPTYLLRIVRDLGIATSKARARAIAQQSGIEELENRVKGVMQALAPVRALRRALGLSPELKMRLGAVRRPADGSALIGLLRG